MSMFFYVLKSNDEKVMLCGRGIGRRWNICRIGAVRVCVFASNKKFLQNLTYRFSKAIYCATIFFGE